MNRLPYCPNPECTKHHNHVPEDSSWRRKRGFDLTKKDKKLQRYQCKICGTTFTENTFSIDYYVEKYVDYRKLLELFITGSGIRDMARTMKCHRNIIINRIGRLSKQIMAVMAEELQDFILQENLAADGLETFVHSQYFPSIINILAGSKSQFIFDCNSYVFKRKGRTTENQKKRKDELYQIARFEPYAASKSFHIILETAAKLMKGSLKKSFILDTDENPIYQKQFSLIDWFEKKVKHRLTNSKEERNRNNKLFPCNYIDRLIRKDMAEHVRETQQFGRNINNMMNRFTSYSFYHNFIKPFRVNERKGQAKTHAEKAGFSQEKIQRILDQVFHGHRRLYHKTEALLNPFQRKLWLMELINPVISTAI